MAESKIMSIYSGAINFVKNIALKNTTIVSHVNWDDTDYYDVDIYLWYIVFAEKDNDHEVILLWHNGTNWTSARISGTDLGIGIGDNALYIPRYVRYTLIQGNISY